MKSYSFKKKKGNLPLFLALFLFVGGYLFFFSSNYWMPANLSAKLQTELRENINWGERTVQIRRWEYLEADAVMEVELDVTNHSYDRKNHYYYSALDRSGKQLTVEAVLEESDWIILRISEIKKDFGEISLRLMKSENDENILRLYTNANDVKRVDSLPKRDKAGYQVLRLQEDMAVYEKQNQSYEKKIKKLQEKTARMLEEIEHLQSKSSYQTEEQLLETDERVKEIQAEMEENEESVASLTEKIKENRKRIDLLNKHISQ